MNFPSFSLLSISSRLRPVRSGMRKYRNTQAITLNSPYSQNVWPTPMAVISESSVRVISRLVPHSAADCTAVPAGRTPSG